MANKRDIHKDLYSCLGEVISLRRKRLGLSQGELAEKSGVDRSFISTVEGGKRNPSLGAVASIAGGLNLKLSRLVTNCEKCLEVRKSQLNQTAPKVVPR